MGSKVIQIRKKENVGVQRALRILWVDFGSLDERDLDRNTNKYRHSHKAALWRSYSKILSSISCFSFPLVKSFSKVKLFTTIKLSIFLIFFCTFVSYIHKKLLWHLTNIYLKWHQRKNKRAKITKPVVLLFRFFFCCAFCCLFSKLHWRWALRRLYLYLHRQRVARSQ